jgi:inorganic pyrophosphatase
MADDDFWDALEQLAAGAKLVIDRPKGSRHPRYPDIVYPLDYGYFEGSASMDGGGVDAWRGSLEDARIVGVICTVDLLKKDSEIKILVGCTPDEIAILRDFHNEGPYMKGVLILR